MPDAGTLNNQSSIINDQSEGICPHIEDTCIFWRSGECRAPTAEDCPIEFKNHLVKQNTEHRSQESE